MTLSIQLLVMSAVLAGAGTLVLLMHGGGRTLPAWVVHVAAWGVHVSMILAAVSLVLLIVPGS